MNHIHLPTWKYHNETLCITILNKQKCHFFLLQKWRTKRQNRFYLGGWSQWGGVGYKERV
jgi:hypothetical protein